MSLARISLLLALAIPLPSQAAGREPQMTQQQALDAAEQRLDNGGDASDISARLHKSRGLSKEDARRLELIDARCALLAGQWATSEKLLGRLRAASPDDARLSEWYARALDGVGKGEQALPLLAKLAEHDQLHDGDSYWMLAQLERKGGERKRALEHARAALAHPIVLQSDELDHEIHRFIVELGGKDK